MSNTFGHLFRVTSFGESHSKGLGCIIDGCPSGLEISLDEIQDFLNERRPGQSEFVTQRKEPDEVHCLSGLENGVSLGTPICLVVYNKDARPGDYSELSQVFRPSHGDFTYFSKYGLRCQSGGGRSSVRETVARVAAAGVARCVLKKFVPELEILPFVESLGPLEFNPRGDFAFTREQVYKSPVRCPDQDASLKMMAHIKSLKEEGDSTGGVIRCLVKNPPVGLGEPVFDKLDALLASAMLSLPAVKGFEIGKGFSSTSMKGSEHNDPFVKREGRVATLTNHSGGVQGGLSNGENLDFRVAFKPTSTIFKEQQTVDHEGNEKTLALHKGRHDPCVLPRAVPIVEAMTYLTLTDLFLRQRLHKNSF